MVKILVGVCVCSCVCAERNSENLENIRIRRLSINCAENLLVKSAHRAGVEAGA